MLHRLPLRAFLIPSALLIALSTAPALVAQDLEAPLDQVEEEPRASAATAYAVPLRGITIDGKLDDWPDDLPRYQILTQYGVYGPTDTDDQDLATSDDLSAYFMVGYDPDEGYVYVAVVVRDDDVVVGNTYDTTDAVEIYIDGKHSRGRDMSDNARPGMQYSGVPGQGSYNGDFNPSVLFGGTELTDPKLGHSREDGTTIYEFAVRPYDTFTTFGPNGPVLDPTELDPGKRIGWDIGIADKDDNDQVPALVFWGPIGAEKYFDTWLLGDLELLDPEVALAPLEVTLTRSDDGKPYAGLDLEAWQGDKPCGVARSDSEGRVTFKLPPGEYELRPAASVGAEPGQSFTAQLAEGGGTAELTVAPVTIPEPLQRSIERYATLKTYRDRTHVQVVGEMPAGEDLRHEIPIEFAFARPNRVRIATPSPLMRGLAVASDGEKMGAKSFDEPLGPIIDAPPHITPLALSEATAGASAHNATGLPMPSVANQSARGRLPTGGLVGGLFAHRLLLAEDPMREVLRGADRIEELGEATLEGEKVTIVEITKPAPHVLTGFPYYGMRRGAPVTFQVAIGEDSLIRQMSFKFDMSKCLNPYFYRDQEKPSQFVTWVSRHRDIEADAELDESVFRVPPTPVEEEE